MTSTTVGLPMCCLLMGITCVYWAEEVSGIVSVDDVATTTTEVCPSGFELFESSCYRLVSDSRITGTEARTACQTLASNSHLVFIQSQSEQTYLEGLAKGAGKNNEYWIGLTYTTDVDHAHWLDGSSLGNFTAWDTFGSFNELSPCVRLRKESNYLWNDKMCSDRYGYICETEPSKPSRKTGTFQISPDNMAAPVGEHHITSLKTSSRFRCAAHCLNHEACAGFNYQHTLLEDSGEKLAELCELYSKIFTDDELIEKHGYKYYRMQIM